MSQSPVLSMLVQEKDSLESSHQSQEYCPGHRLLGGNERICHSRDVLMHRALIASHPYRTFSRKASLHTSDI